MEIKKRALAETSPEALELERISQFSRRALRAEEVYTFAVRLCDNDIDRDFERFDRAGLERLGELFLGKSGLFDHQWSANGQCARLYRTEVCEEEGQVAGEQRCCLKGWAYMLRSESNRDLIGEIEAGIKKEVSVGCAVERRVCSVCGGEIGTCGHIPGRRYDGSLCYATLCNPTDAYEWSFVAVPAQRRAGVVKSLRSMAEEKGLQKEWEELAGQAALGRRYIEELRSEVVRLMGQAEQDMDRHLVLHITSHLGLEALLALRKIYRRRTEGMGMPQLGARPGELADSGAFLV